MYTISSPLRGFRYIYSSYLITVTWLGFHRLWALLLAPRNHDAQPAAIVQPATITQLSLHPLSYRVLILSLFYRILAPRNHDAEPTAIVQPAKITQLPSHPLSYRILILSLFYRVLLNHYIIVLILHLLRIHSLFYRVLLDHYIIVLILHLLRILT
jgi:hypothetical protein